MPEHLIRLRGGWLWHDPRAGSADDAPGSSRGATLPMTRPAFPGGRVRLSRRFGIPAFDPARETLSLRLARVGGLTSAQLNGREIARPSPETTAMDVPLPDPLPRRNLLVLEVDFPGVGPQPDAWGMVALVITPRGEVRGHAGRAPRGEVDLEGEEDSLGDGSGRA
jgi:hypothetical protein